MSKKAFVYWNLHRGMWSVKDITPGSPTYGRVIDRRRNVLLKDAVGKVSQAGRERVLRERKKNVHAGIVGTLLSLEDTESQDVATATEWIGDRVTYNPCKYESFVHTVDGSKFEGSAYALLTADRAVFVA